jgi:hypothetical protein
MDISGYSFEKIVDHFENLGVNSNMSIPIILNWAEKNNVTFNKDKVKHTPRWGNL